ncbi:unnamed protein product [Rotaria sp. Silwood2]|nr:unnamed protein product [Rotaria sp. Silwood2]CAF4489342.1 unnamed protein product [Rotaria sp. Silwood2]CAF4489955.1 unnamed protein product [Rotaria sp. Silwood2]
METHMLKVLEITKQSSTYRALNNFHQRTHSRPTCQTIMKFDHPSHERRFTGLSSQTAEHVFQFIIRAKCSLRNFSYPHSTVMLMLILHLKNCGIVGLSENEVGISASYFDYEINEYFSRPCIFETFGAMEQSDEDTDEDINLEENDDESTMEE